MLKKMTTTAASVVLIWMIMSTAAVAAGHGGKVARGLTAQGRSIRMNLSPATIVIRGFSIELRCSGDFVLVDQESDFRPSTVSKGQIHDSQVGPTDEVLIRGRLGARVVHGRIRVRDRLGKHRCSSSWVPFTAKVGR